MSEIRLSKLAKRQAQNSIVQNIQLDSLIPIERHWEAIGSLSEEQQLLLIAIVSFSLATGSTTEEALELLDPDCLYVSDSLGELLETISTCSPVQQLILVQAIASAVGLSLFDGDIEE